MSPPQNSQASDPHIAPAATYFQELQARIVESLERLDGSASFGRDDWVPEPDLATGGPVLGGLGRTCVLEGGAVLEKAGVAFSQVHGRFSEAFAATMPGEGLEFHATGISLVLHPRSPWIPTVHMNCRRIARGSVGWFGGGADLTPYYYDADDTRHFHGVLRAACRDFADVADHGALKSACDRYFHLPHRGEARGVGGIFFDHIAAQPDRAFAFVQATGDAFLDAWLPIAQRHKARTWTQRERDWQLLRRGRYVEFNLVHDRGTLFGLKTGGRIESILMSMPPLAAWHYRREPDPGSPEATLLAIVRGGLPPGLLDAECSASSPSP